MQKKVRICTKFVQITYRGFVKIFIVDLKLFFWYRVKLDIIFRAVIWFIWQDFHSLRPEKIGYFLSFGSLDHTKLLFVRRRLVDFPLPINLYRLPYSFQSNQTDRTPILVQKNMILFVLQKYVLNN